MYKRQPYLRPNQFVNYTKSTKVVKKAASITKNCKNDLAKVKKVYNYVIKNYKYDKKLARTVKPGYVPNLNKIYKKKKRALEAEIEIAHENLRRKEIETQNKLNQMEQSANDRIRAAENELHRRTEEFNGRVDQFNKEQKLRESLEGKSDRDVIIEMHVKAERISDAICNIESKLVGVQDYSDHLVSLESNLVESVNDLEKSLEDSVGQLETELRFSLSDMDSTIRDAISENMNSLDESDVRSACADAMNYDLSLIHI